MFTQRFYQNDGATHDSKTTFEVLGSKEKGGKLEKFNHHPTTLGDTDVEVEISMSGLCHTDLHMVDNDWGISIYPQIPGHEGVGTIVAKGPNVRGLDLGTRVGVAWMRDSCGHCKDCDVGHQNTCQAGYLTLLPTVFTPPSHNGTFAKKVRVNSKFVFPIPKEIDSVSAAPLLCAGITVYTPLREHITRPGMNVGIIGIGGLGHLAIQIASKMGANVTAYSTSANKESEAKEFGAHRFVCIKDEKAMKSEELSQDIVIDTATEPLNWGIWLGQGWPAGVLRNTGKFIIVGIPATNIPVPVIPLVFGHKQVIGSIIGGSHYMNEMFNFCAIHNIRPKTEVMHFDQINEAFAKVKKNEQRYRIVLKW